VRRQVLGYKLDDRSIEQDAVMALACMVAEARRTPDNASEAVDFDAFGLAGVPRHRRNDRFVIAANGEPF
jgi:hypothetical protein